MHHFRMPLRVPTLASPLKLAVSHRRVQLYLSAGNAEKTKAQELLRVHCIVVYRCDAMIPHGRNVSSRGNQIHAVVCYPQQSEKVHMRACYRDIASLYNIKATQLMTHHMSTNHYGPSRLPRAAATVQHKSTIVYSCFECQYLYAAPVGAFQ